jgi:electron transport complex protein RnfB
MEPMAEAAPAASVALIDETLCIGCTHCRDACPVDAITGAHQFMHTIIASECTGCELCLPPCPVDCISMVGIP